jgi:translation initiation factor IF-1
VAQAERRHADMTGTGRYWIIALDNKHLVLATICGKMPQRWVRLTVGDRVKMEISRYGLDKARMTWRLK